MQSQPIPMPEEKEEKIKLKLPIALIAACQKQAKSEGISPTDLIQKAIEHYLNHSDRSSIYATVDEVKALRIQLENLEAKISGLASNSLSAIASSPDRPPAKISNQDWDEDDEPDEVLTDFL